MPKNGQKLLMSAPILVVAESISAAAHGGGIGAIAALGAAGLAYAYADEITGMFRRGESSPAGPVVPRESGTKLKSAGYRLLVGKSARKASDVDGDGDDDIPLPRTGSQRGEMFTLSDLLDEGFVPSMDRICIGRELDGSLVTVSVDDLCHIALPGTTGNGKSSIMRLIMAQLCFVGVPVLLLNPHYMRYNYKSGEDWTPFEPYLQKSPLDCAGYAAIDILLRWMAETLLKRRIERGAHGHKPGKPYFILIDEWPSINGELKGMSKFLGKILREGRKYGINVMVASTDFSVKTLGMEGEGSLRKCFLTTFYVGGDPTGGRELLNMSPDELPEDELGKGTVMLRYRVGTAENGVSKMRTVMVQVPFTDNDALYRMLGPSTFDFDGDQDDDDDVSDFEEPGDGQQQENDPLASNYHERDYSEEIATAEPETEQLKSAARANAPAPTTKSVLSKHESMVLKAYEDGAKVATAIAAATGIPASKVNQTLHSLSLKGLIDWQGRR